MPKKIKYVGFWKDFDPQNNFLQQVLNSAGCDVELSENPDYLICSVFGHEALDPIYDDCVKILYTGENLCPDFNLYDYAIGFEYLDFGDRYLRFPLCYSDEFKLAYDAMLGKHLEAREWLARKTDFCSFVYSNGKGNLIREHFFTKLSEYKKVDSGGRYLNNIGMPEGVKDKIEFESRHKFSIAFENSSSPGYTTEKLIQSFAAATVPIYWGDPEVKKVFNPDSFIFANDYDSLEQVIDKIKEIDQNDELFLKYLSAPALHDSAKVDKETHFQKLTHFFENIFKQDKEYAFRRNKIVRGQLYLNEMQRAFDALQDKGNKTIVEKVFYTLRREGLPGIFKRIKDKL